MVDHLFRHAAVDADILPCDKPGLGGTEKEDHVGDVQGISHPSRRVLGGVGSRVLSKSGVDPAGRNGIDADVSGETHGQGVGEGGNAAFGSRVALRLGLAHPIPGGGDIDDGGAGSEIGQKQLGQVERRRHAHPQGVVEFVVGTVGDPFH